MKIPHSYECPGPGFIEGVPACECGATEREVARLWAAFDAIEAEIEAFNDEVYGTAVGEQRHGDETL